MGLFHDKCEALIDIATGVALTGEALAAAKEIYNSKGNAFGQRDRALKEHGWAVCGHSVPKRARVCTKCGSRAPGGWIKCPVCHKWIGNESKFCPHCNHELYPEDRVAMAGGIWKREAGDFARRFEIEDGASILKQGLHIQEGTVAIMIDSGRVCGVLKPGRHEPNGTLHKINWFFNPPIRSVLMVDQGDVVYRLNFDNLKSADGFSMKMFAEVTVRFVPSKAVDFMENVLKGERFISSENFGKWLVNEINYAAENLCIKTTVEDLVINPNRREFFEDELSRTIKDLFKRCGLELIRVGYIDFQSKEFDDLRNANEELDKARRQFVFDQKVMEFAASKEAAAIADDLERIKRNNQAESDKLDESNALAEYKAKKELELSEYIDQLAQEQQISEEDRRTEWEIVRKVAEGKITAEEAKQQLATVQQAHLKRMAILANDQEYQLTVDNFTRESQIANAEQRAKLNEYNRIEALKDKQSEIEIYETDVVGRAHAEAKAEVYRLEQLKLKNQGRVDTAETDLKVTKAEQAGRRITIENDTYEAKEWQKLRLEKDAHDVEMERNRINMRKGLSATEFAAISSDPAAAARFIELAKMTSAQNLTAEQMLALNASQSAVEGIKAIMAANDKTNDRLLEELQKLHDTDHDRYDETIKNFMEMFKHATTLQERTATTAAGRTDHHEHHHDQQIIK